MLQHTPILLIGASLGMIQGIRHLQQRDIAVIDQPGEWPTHFEGSTLHRIPASKFEQRFGANFPGEIASFSSAGKQIILRRVTRTTRRLHPSEHCLRSSGYDITPIGHDPEGWLCYYASRGGKRLHVRERITESSGERVWTTPSNWFWHATFHPQSGPWLATTVITPLNFE
ncbi:MAG: hypothetical protein Q7Q71_04650 [Verrucomicrobiota bacterium JB023]|nr:hypothetical protein [Verrucomicrobiota bacterium JB023]